MSRADHQHRSLDARSRVANHDAIAVVDLADLFGSDPVIGELRDCCLREQQDGDQHRAKVLTLPTTDHSCGEDALHGVLPHPTERRSERVTEWARSVPPRSRSGCLGQTSAFGQEQQRADVSRLRLRRVLSGHVVGADRDARSFRQRSHRNSTLETTMPELRTTVPAYWASWSGWRRTA
jgi:hypothetical protein